MSELGDRCGDEIGGGLSRWQPVNSPAVAQGFRHERSRHQKGQLILFDLLPDKTRSTQK
jgi:hypothetical protein